MTKLHVSNGDVLVDNPNNGIVLVSPNSMHWKLTVNNDGSLNTDTMEYIMPTDSLIAYYPFNGNANDESGNGNNGILYGSVSITDKYGNINNALQFNGAGDYIAIPSSNTLNPVNQLTINLWVKIDTFTNRFTSILHKGGTEVSDQSNREYTLYVEDNKNIYTESYGNINRIYCAYQIPDINVWFMYTSVIDRINGKLKIYINGKKKTEIVDSNTLFNNNNDSIKIATWEEAHSSYAEYFKGSLDNLRIYNRALSEKEIQLLYNEY